MKRKFFAFVALLSATLSLSSCLNSDNTTVEYTHDTAITAFSLGKLDRWTKTAAGKDTLLKSNLDGSKYKFYIDQTLRKIYNVDSLPCGVRDTAILATISSKESSPVILMDIDKTDSIAAYYSSSDSINFSKPRYIRVYNNEYSAYVTYEVTVNVHKQEPNVFNWQLGYQRNEQLAALTNLKMLPLGDYIYVIGQNANGVKLYKSAKTDGVNWTEVTAKPNLSVEAYLNAVAMNGAVYVLSEENLWRTTNMETWSVKGGYAGDDFQLKQLIGASSKNLYAYTDKGIAVSENEGESWTTESLDTDTRYLPTRNLSMCVSSISSVKDAENVFLLGTRDASYGDTIATIWNHVADYSVNAPKTAWNYLELEAGQKGKLPYLDEMLACAADTGYVALGDNGNWYKSKDNGLTWSVDSLITMPASFEVATSRFGFCRDADKFYWVIRNGYVWKGRFNKDGWRKEQTIFE